MNISINKPITTLYETAKKELYTAPIQSLGILAGVFAILIPLLLSESLRGFLLYRLSRSLQQEVVLSLLPLLIAFLSLLCALYVLNSHPNEFKIKYKFYSYNGYTWRLHHDKSNNIKFSDGTYCDAHKIKYTEVDRLLICPFCDSSDALEVDINYESSSRDIARSMLDSIKNNHITCDKIT